MKSKDNKYCMLVLVFAGIALLGAIYRCFFGVDLLDEAFQAGESVLMSQGMVPFVDYRHTNGAGLFNAFIVDFVHFAFGGNEFLILAMRFFNVIARVVVLIAIFLLFCKRVDWKIVLLSFIPCIVFPFQGVGYSLNYYSIPGILRFLVSILLIYTAYCRKTFFIPFVAGLFTGALVYANPLDFLCVIFFLICVVYQSYKEKNISITVGYITGGFLIAVVITSFMLMKAGSVTSLVNDVAGIFTAGYFSIERMSFIEQISRVAAKLGIPAIGYSCAIIIVCFINKKQNQKDEGRIITIQVLVFTMLIEYILSFILKKEKSFGCQLSWIIAVEFSFIIVILSKNRDRVFQYLILIMPGILNLVVCYFLAFGGINNRYFVLFPACIMGIYTLWEMIPCDTEFHRIKRWRLSFVTTAVITIGIFALAFSYNSCDLPSYDLNTYIKSGPYRGMKTNENTAKRLKILDSAIEEYIPKNETVMFRDLIPSAYILADTQFMAPSSWDLVQYCLDLKDCSCLYDFFEIKENIPDNIAYIGIPEELSLYDNEFDFNVFIDENYILLLDKELENGDHFILYRNKKI